MHIIRPHYRLLPLFLLVLLFGVLPNLSAARIYDASPLPYEDSASFDAATAVSVSVLTEEGVLEGNPDGTFRPGDYLNRAEFMKIVMHFYASDDAVDLRCFPDVASNVWYAEPVCRAKQYGIVRGNADPDLAENLWRFEPTRRVQYEEAIKVLVKIFAIPSADGEGDHWYVPYLDAAAERNLTLPGLAVGDTLTRGEMARLTARFFAHSEGDLQAFLNAEQGAVNEFCEPYVCKDGTIVPACTPDGHQINYFAEPCLTHGGQVTDDEDPVDQDGDEDENDNDNATFDPLPGTNTSANILLLGETSSIMGAATLFSNSEPVDIRDILVILENPSDSVDHFLVYMQDDGEYLGRASRDVTRGTNYYRLHLPSSARMVDRREEFQFYVRAVTKGFHDGGESGEIVEIDSLRLEGNGVWSSESFGQSTTDDYAAFETSRSRITRIANAGDTEDTLFSGNNITLGSFRLEGEVGDGDGSAKLHITNLDVTIEQHGGVVVSDVTLGADGTTERHNCSVASNMITCASIPESFTSFDDVDRVMTFYGDVTVPDSASSAHLRLKINDPGTTVSAGDVTWTDGTSVFTWLASGFPVAVSTNYMR
jgi:hypothetical protein